MGETRVDLHRLLEDLRDAYPGSIEETILTEVVANALDSGAREISLVTDSVAATCTVIDDGKGMSRPALSRYHDVAVTSKSRGQSIGFAGVGIKLGLLVSDEVVTETRTPRAKKSLATSWRLGSRTRAPWRWIEPPGLVRDKGTAVRLYLSNPLSHLLDSGFVEATVLRHFEPLFDEEICRSILAAYYPDGVRFRLNGRLLARTAAGPGRARLEIRVGRQRKPSGVGFLTQNNEIGEEDRGLAVSTLGKVITRGWDWIGLSPAQAETVSGLIEVPALAESLTLNKAEFIRRGARGATFLAYRKALQGAVSMQLEAWGEAAAPPPEPKRRTRTLERDLRSVLASLSDPYPLLATLVERRPGGQRRLPLGGEPAPRGLAPGAGPDLSIPGASPPASGVNGANETSPSDADKRDPDSRGEQRESAGERRESGLPGRKSSRKPARYGLRIRFESRPEDPDLGRLVESTVWVNSAHPAYARAVASRSEGYHVALAVAMSLAALAVEAGQARRFVSDFLASWGEAGANGKPKPRSGRRPRTRGAAEPRTPAGKQ